MTDDAQTKDLCEGLRVLVIDDNQAEVEAVAEALESIGCQCEMATCGKDGLELIRNGNVDVVVTDLIMNDVGGMEVTEETKRYWPEVEVLVLTGHASVSSAVEAMQKGALTYLEKPVDINVLRAQVRKAAEKQSVVRERAALKRTIDKRYGFEQIIGQSHAMQRVFEVLDQISASNATVMIEGESGTGKELVARAIHNNSPRRARSFVGLNCAALSEGILESELFGHEKGAFTGADQQRLGRFEYADHGTLFLDEVGDMPMTTQIKFLRVLEEREIMRVGSNDPIKVDVRVLAATNRSLEELVQEGRFRGDLYFRLNVVRISLPPLRARHDDIPLLIAAFIREFGEENDKEINGITPDARSILYRYSWPGNVRELRNCIESMIVTTRSTMLEVVDIPPHISAMPVGAREGLKMVAGMSLKEAEETLIKETLEMTGGNREEAARILKIGERTLYRKLDRYGLK